MAAQNPIILDTITMLADVWVKVATAVTRGFVHILKGDLVYYQTHRLTGETAPDDLILPDNPDFEGTPICTRVDTNVDFNWGSSPCEGIGSEYFSVRWTGKLVS